MNLRYLDMTTGLEVGQQDVRFNDLYLRFAVSAF